MTTYLQHDRAPAASNQTRLRRALTAAALVPLLALAACSGDPAPGTTATEPASPNAGSTEGAGTGSTDAGGAPTATATPTKVVTALNVTISDPDLAQRITVRKLARNLPWKDPSSPSAAAFEIIGVELTFDAGVRYTAVLQPSMLTLATDKTPNAKPTSEFGGSFGTPLVPVARANARTGWVFFKVDRGSSSAVVLTYHRPAYKVSTTGKAIPAKAFRVALAK